MNLSGILEFDLGKGSKIWSWKPILECVWWYWHSKACGIVAPKPEIEPAPPASEGEVLTTLPVGKSWGNLLKILISGPFPTCKILIPHSQVLLRNLSLLQVPGTGGPNTIFWKTRAMGQRHCQQFSTFASIKIVYQISIFRDEAGKVHVDIAPWVFLMSPEAVLLRLYCVDESGIFLSPRFWFGRVKVGPEILHVQHSLRCCCCFWSGTTLSAARHWRLRTTWVFSLRILRLCPSACTASIKGPSVSNRICVY